MSLEVWFKADVKDRIEALALVGGQHADRQWREGFYCGLAAVALAFGLKDTAAGLSALTTEGERISERRQPR